MPMLRSSDATARGRPHDLVALREATAHRIAPGPAEGRHRRLDVFRGIAMLIIVLAHVRGDSWALWIPARFGFSDATEIFVFCSGLASALAFGRLFEARGLWRGTVRVGCRVPLSWVRLYAPGFCLPDSSAWQASFAAARDALTPLHAKSPLGLLRYGHFLAVAYLAWVAVGPGGRALSAPLPITETAPARCHRVLAAAGLLALATAPYVDLETLAALSPGAGSRLAAVWRMPPAGQAGLLHVLHFAAVITFVGNAMPEAARGWLQDEGWSRAVRAVRKVGTQSLAVFMTSIPLAIMAGLVLDWTGRECLATAAVNLAGFAFLIALAYVLAWIKSHPWRRRPMPQSAAVSVAAAAPAE